MNVAARMGHHMEYAVSVTQENNEQNNAITTCIYGWWKALWLQFCIKPFFSQQQRNKFYLTIMVVVKLEKVPPTQSQLSIIINAIKFKLSNMMRFT